MPSPSGGVASAGRDRPPSRRWERVRRGGARDSADNRLVSGDTAMLSAITRSGAEPAVSVVICSYAPERWDDLVTAVRSVQEQTVAPLELIVCVDHNEAMLERVRAELPDIVAVANGQVRGLSGARNSGLGIARGD